MLIAPISAHASDDMPWSAFASPPVINIPSAGNAASRSVVWVFQAAVTFSLDRETKQICSRKWRRKTFNVRHASDYPCISLLSKIHQTSIPPETVILHELLVYCM